MVAEHKVKHLMKFVEKAEMQEFNTANGTFESDDVMPLSFSLGKICFEAKPYLMEESLQFCQWVCGAWTRIFVICGSRDLTLALLLP